MSKQVIQDIIALKFDKWLDNLFNTNSQSTIYFNSASFVFLDRVKCLQALKEIQPAVRLHSQWIYCPVYCDAAAVKLLETVKELVNGDLLNLRRSSCDCGIAHGSGAGMWRRNVSPEITTVLEILLGIQIRKCYCWVQCTWF